MLSNPAIIPFHTPNPDKRHRKWSRSWKNKRNKSGNRIHKPHQYNVVDMLYA